MNWLSRFKMIPLMILIACIAVPLAAQERGDIERQDGKYVEEILKVLEVDEGGTLTVRTPKGAIEVGSWAKDKVQVRVLKRYRGSSEDRAEQALENIEVYIDKHGNDVRVQAETENRRYNDKTDLFFDITVPARYNVDLETRGGSISIDDLEGRVLAETAGGSISVGRIKSGDVDVETKGGSISIDGIEDGSGMAVTAGGSITVGDVTGTLDVKTAGGSIHLDRIGGRTHAKTSGGSIAVESCGDDLVAETAGGSIQIGSVKGDVTVDTAGGSITVGPATGDVDARTSGGSIRLKDCGGSVTAGTSGGGITVNGSGGPVEVETSGGSIQIDDAHGYIEAKTAGGSIEAEMKVSKKDADTHCLLTSSGGDLILWIPEDLPASFDVELKVTRWTDEDYEISSDFPLTINRGNHRVSCSGDINGGGDPIRLRTVNGDIEIRKLR
jgi:DUF4097 and DUF4098 domain-containing protein YvlB